jgi:hypothetical protein
MTAAHMQNAEMIAAKATRGYVVHDAIEVNAFLCEHPELRPILVAAPERVARAFGKRMPLRLRIFRDREEPSCGELIVDILTGASGSDAWSAADANLRQLHEQWLAALPRETVRNILFVAEPT